MTTYANRRRRAHLKGIVPLHAEAAALVKDAGDIAIVKRDRLRSVVMRCPDGCGETITLNLDARTAKAWRVYNSKRGLTLFPSIWRDTGCQSHFVVWNNTISWVDIFEESEEADTKGRRLLEERVWRTLKSNAFTDFVQVADSLAEIPWDVLDVCRRLVKEKRAIAGTGPMKSCFKKVESR